MGTTETAYIPGECNINKAEIAKRRMIGHVGLVIFVIVLVAFAVIDISRWYRIILFLPGMIAASGYLQARNQFCTGYARAGKQNAAQGSNAASDINDIDARAKDKRKAKHMNIQAALIALIAMVITLFL